MVCHGPARPGSVGHGTAMQEEARKAQLEVEFQLCLTNIKEFGMKVIDISIAGLSPLIMHKFTDKAAESATSGARVSSANTDRGTPHEQAEECLYVDDGGIIIIPQPNIFQSIISAGRFFKNGKSKITTLKSSLIPAAVVLPLEYTKLEFDEPWTVDTRPVRIPSTGGRILRHRPRFENWSCGFIAELDEGDISEKLFREIVGAAGAKVGLCDFRPETRGPFGRFSIVNWSIDKS